MQSIDKILIFLDDSKSLDLSASHGEKRHVSH